MKNKIILADDELNCNRALSAILNLEGFEVRVFSNGREAQDYISESCGYDALIADRRIGGEDCLSQVTGDELLELSAKLHPKARRICISGYDEKPRHAEKFFSKPLSQEDIEEMIRYLRK